MSRLEEITKELWSKLDTTKMDFECEVQYLQEEGNAIILSEVGVTQDDLGDCVMCRKQITELAKDEIGLIRRDAYGRLWCKSCTDDHANIDWT